MSLYKKLLRPVIYTLYNVFRILFIGIVLALLCGGVFGTFFGACTFASEYTKQVLTK